MIYPMFEWSEQHDPASWSTPRATFTEPIVGLAPHDDGVRVTLQSGREYVIALPAR